MVRKLIGWSLDNPLVVILLAVFLGVIGLYSFAHVNVEAYPDPAPAIVEVIALFPGASAEEVERQVTVPLEVTFYAMPGLKKINSKSLFGLSDLKMTWHYGSQYTYQTARQEVINRLATIAQPLPPNVTPTISPESPTGEIFRYVINVPKDASGREIYTPNDIKAMQDWVLEREFRKVPRIVDVSSFGGTIRRYEVQPDPDRLRRYGITLGQVQSALQNSNFTVGGNYLNSGQTAQTVRSMAVFGGALDPVNRVLGMKSPEQSAAILRAEELRRVQEIRSVVIATINSQPIRIDDIVEGGRVGPDELPGERGVVVSNLTRLGRIGYYNADRERPSGSTQALRDVGHDEDDKVQCIVLMRKGEDTTPCLKDVNAKFKEINNPSFGRLLPGTQLETYYDRTDLFNITTETVTENLCLGVALVVAILFMFVNNIKTAVIVAINIPLALAFAFGMLFIRGKSANLLSIGAVDFGIIVDSCVVVVENINRNLASGNYADLPIKERIKHFVHEIDHALLFSVLIMVCAFTPLFLMTGAEGQLFRPMAQTYAFSLAAALVLAVTLTPVLCMLLFKNFKPAHENMLVRALKF
ncbi:MAG TPA: efflux RND transporter permease subunit, partial [Pirellulales bacterium]|nr:efflux RND transporter permease subunit [Pirellulales bacterium]